MVLKQVEKSDCDYILEIRNDKEVRKFMFDDTVISKDIHNEWFVCALANSQKLMYLLWDNNHPVGFIQFDLNDKNEAKWGFYNSPASPAGTGTIMLKLALREIFISHGVDKVYGKVLLCNLASQKLHQKLGFTWIIEKDSESSNRIMLFSLSKQSWFEILNMEE